MFNCPNLIGHCGSLDIVDFTKCFAGNAPFRILQQNLKVIRHVLSERLRCLLENDILIKTSYAQRQERYK